jgi:hypothetical protein
MFKGRFLQFLTLALSIAMVGVLTIPAMAADVPKITKGELKSMFGTPDLVIVDVRTGTSWTASEKKIKGAVREDPKDVEPWANKYPKDKILVLY